jgi:hypothetical protein
LRYGQLMIMTDQVSDHILAIGSNATERARHRIMTVRTSRDF